MKAADVVRNYWGWLSQALPQNPEPILAGLFFALMVLLTISAIVLFTRLRTLGTRQRQLQRSLDHQAAEAAQIRAYIDAKIQTLLAHQERAISALSTVTQKYSQEFPAETVREELASVRTDFLTGRAKGAENNQADS